MTTLVFLATLAAIFIAVMLGESDQEAGVARHRPAGLLTWLAHGNWPAKVGGLLVLVGVGALLRYALIHVDVPPVAKLSAGVVLAVVFGFLATIVPDGPARRPVSLALGGAAFGVAYLTAYSAFALFGYLSNPLGLGLLGLTSVAAATYAVHRSALSLALLSMVGAFLAPAFAIDDPGPVVVYGYYVGAGILTLVMVMLRGWRPLIHLSFLFTLAGGVFFAWTSRYFAGPYAREMLAFIVVLAALHVAMPLLERRGSRQRWIESLDFLYLIALPVVAVILSYFVSESRTQFSGEVFLLAGVWALAAGALAMARREGAAAHAAIAGLLAALAVAVRFRDLPWELLLLTLSVAALAAAAWRRSPVERLHGTLAGGVVLFGALHMLDAVSTQAAGPAFANGAFAERLFGAVLLVLAGSICRRIRQPLDTLLLAMGILWGVLAIGVELVRIELATVALVVHGSLVLLAGSLWIPGRKLLLVDRNVATLAVAITLTAAWAAAGEPSLPVACFMLAASVLALVGLAVRPLVIEGTDPGQRALAALAAPAAAGIWALSAAHAAELGSFRPGLVAASLTAVGVLLAGRAIPGPRGDWLERIVEIFGAGFALVLAASTILHIVRSPWAIALEFCCLAGLVTVTWIRASRQQTVEVSTVACVLGLALVLQANFLRWLGPPGSLDLTDLLEVRWPAVISLLWVAVASLLTLWARKTASRSLWIAGATLLVVSAVKLLIYDFGSLGDLANILAVIAAGGVFLLVGWLAPMPPAAPPNEEPPAPRARSAPPAPPVPPTSARAAGPPHAAAQRAGAASAPAHATAPADSPGAMRTVAIVIAVAAGFYYFQNLAGAFLGGTLFGSPDRHRSVLVEPRPTFANPTRSGAGTPRPVAEPPATLETRVYELEPPAATPRPDYVPPPTRNPDGSRNYTQFSYPQQRPAEADGVPQQPAAREEGIDQLIREGRIRPATRQDVDLWIAATGADRSELHLDLVDYSSGNRYIFKTYVVQREMTFPDGLYGAHSATFIVPRGVPRPYGDPGHSRVLDTP